MPKIVPGGYKEMVVQEDDKKFWWDKYESNSEKRAREQNILMTQDDLKFLKEFGSINVSIAGIFALTKILKK